MAETKQMLIGQDIQSHSNDINHVFYPQMGYQYRNEPRRQAAVNGIAEQKPEDMQTLTRLEPLAPTELLSRLRAATN